MSDFDLNALAQETAKHLDGFSYQPDPHCPSNARLVHDDGRALRLHSGWKTRGSRVTVAGSYPVPDELRDQVRGLENQEITVAVERGGQVLAREITRRLLPEYTKTYEDVLARIALVIESNLDRAALADGLVRRLPEASITPSQNGYTMIHFVARDRDTSPSGRVQLSGNGSHIRWEFDGGSHDFHKAMAELVARHYHEQTVTTRRSTQPFTITAR